MCISFPFSSHLIHSYELVTCWSILPFQHDNSPPVSLCSRVPPDVYEWRSMQLAEALPVPAWLHRSALPVSTPADAASSGSARQQAACLPHIFEARRPETGGAIRHRAYPVVANTLSFHLTLHTSRAPLIWRYLSFTTVNVRTFSWLVLSDGENVCFFKTFCFSDVFPFLYFQCSLMCVFTTRRTPPWSFNLSTNQMSSLLTRQGHARSPRGTIRRAAASRRPHPNKPWV